MVRYSLLRILLLFGCLIILWLVGGLFPALRDPVWLLLGTAVISYAVFCLIHNSPREELARQLAAKVDERTARRRSDAEEEDLEVRRQEGDQPPAGPSPGSGER